MLAGGFFACQKTPFPPPGGGWPRRGRERNAGGKLKVSTTKQTSARVTTKSAHWWRSLHFRNRYIATRIPLQSENRFRRADFLTASPRGKRLGATAPEGSLTVYHTADAFASAVFFCGRHIQSPAAELPRLRPFFGISHRGVPFFTNFDCVKELM